MSLAGKKAARLAAGLMLLAPVLVLAAGGGCLACHEDEAQGFNSAHGFARDNCTACHAGDSTASDANSAHLRLEPFPGNMANAAQTCGACHADKVESVSHSLMHSGRGMVSITRKLVDGEVGLSGSNNIQSLGHSPADSMLRKLCVSCHLGQPKTAHALDPGSDRGGGCLACHINHYPEDAHPALSTAVSDARCFGCHSRSGRISLSYTGLAEVDATAGPHLRLGDGRPVARMPADAHYLAGMSCIDCHRGAEVMGEVEQIEQRRGTGKASCTDCHAPETGHADLLVDHQRLECATCHSQWAPKCFGCHMEYEPDGRQWDHLEKRETPGRWHEERWAIRNGLPVLGVNARGRIDAFVPGMIMSIDHPGWEDEKFLRVFAPLSPHTTGRARSCESCHRSSEALGLGEGEVTVLDGKVQFAPRHPRSRDGLPEDAWTSPSGEGGTAASEKMRPLSPAEMLKVLRAPLPGTSPAIAQQPSAAAGGGMPPAAGSDSTNTGGVNGFAGGGVSPAHSPTK